MATPPARQTSTSCREKKPTKKALRNAAGKHVRDVIAPGLKVLFVGINPSLYTAAVGHHFARPGNRFWGVLHRAGMTDRKLSPADERRLLALGFGITNFVSRATAKAAELKRQEVFDGTRRLRAKVRRYGPECIAILGIETYRLAFNQPRAGIGLQPVLLGESAVWVLPNPSGLNARYQMHDLIHLFRQLHTAVKTGRFGR